jgi:hypothetical protein
MVLVSGFSILMEVQEQLCLQFQLKKLIPFERFMVKLILYSIIFSIPTNFRLIIDEHDETST